MGLGRGGILRVDKPAVTGVDEMSHFAFDVVPKPDYKTVMTSHLE